MKRLLVCLVATTTLILLPASARASAQPVSRATARAEIEHHYWRGTDRMRIRWCVPKRYGTICMLSVPVRHANKFGWVRGHEMQCVWVSRTDGRISVAFLWGSLSMSLAL